MKATRARHSATLIGSGPLSGNVLIAGGTSDEGGGDVATAELYDPTTGQFALTGRMRRRAKITAPPFFRRASFQGLWRAMCWSRAALT